MMGTYGISGDSNPNQVVYRGVSQRFKNLQPGDVLTFSQFTSTTLNPAVAKNFGAGTLLIIKGNNPKPNIKEVEGTSPMHPQIDVMNHSVYKSEQEFLFRPFVKFVVVNKEQKEDEDVVELRIHPINSWPVVGQFNILPRVMGQQKAVFGNSIIVWSLQNKRQ